VQDVAENELIHELVRGPGLRPVLTDGIPEWGRKLSLTKSGARDGLRVQPGCIEWGPDSPWNR